MDENERAGCFAFIVFQSLKGNSNPNDKYVLSERAL